MFIGPRTTAEESTEMLAIPHHGSRNGRDSVVVLWSMRRLNRGLCYVVLRARRTDRIRDKMALESSYR